MRVGSARGTLTGVLAILLATSGCSVASRANDAPLPTYPTPTVVPTVINPPQAEGLDGRAGVGAPGPQVCTAITRTLTTQLKVPVTAEPNSWNDGGLPAMDLCTLHVQNRAVTIGVTALPTRPDALTRLMHGAATIQALPEIGPQALIADSQLVFITDNRAVRLMPDGGILDNGALDGIDRTKAVTIAIAARDAVPRSLRAERQPDEACQVSNSAAERFVAQVVQLRRDYRVHGALTCIWGTPDATVSIVEAFDQPTIPEAQSVPPPELAPIGQPGYYLPGAGELVFRQGRRVVRVTGLTNPPRQVTLNTLTNIVDPLLPLFLR